MTLQDQAPAADLRAGIAKRIRQIALMVAFMAAALFVAAGRIDWLWAWVFLGMYVVGIGINAYFMLRYSPETTPAAPRPRA